MTSELQIGGEGGLLERLSMLWSMSEMHNSYQAHDLQSFCDEKADRDGFRLLYLSICHYG